MRPYKINEYFVSVQGEGDSIGHPALFVRFSGCNLSCDFCDTDHENGCVHDSPHTFFESVATALLEEKLFEGMRCVFTGGEPLLQLDAAMVEEAVRRGFVPCIETNGHMLTEKKCAEKNLEEMLLMCKEVCVSPKSNNVSELILECATSMKVVYPHTLDLKPLVRKIGQKRSFPGMSRVLIFQPETPLYGLKGMDSKEYAEVCCAAINEAIARRKSFGEVWRVIPQAHVVMGVR